MGLKIGDIVARKSYGGDIFFKVVEIRDNGKEIVAILKGIAYRIEADAPESDLLILPDQRVNEYNSRMRIVVDKKCKDIQLVKEKSSPKKALFRDTPKENARKFSRPGKVLHIDGDNEYLSTCLNQYKKFGIDSVGVYFPEKEQPSSIYNILQQHRPDILVLTGHDGVIKGDKSYLNIDNYRNSKYFIESVKEARRYEGDLDSLVIFAGACQSMYSKLIAAGANFASAPYRVLIHALDPVFVCQKVAYTNISKVILPSEVISNTITGIEGIGGVQTRGKFRDGFPLEPYEN